MRFHDGSELENTSTLPRFPNFDTVEAHQFEVIGTDY